MVPGWEEVRKMLSRTGFKERKDPGRQRGPGKISVREWDLEKNLRTDY